MKKILLSVSLLCLGVAGNLQAQSFVTNSGSADTVAEGYTPGDMFVNNYLRSNTGADITLNWRISTIDTTGGWHFIGFCDNDLCYNPPAVLENSYSPVYGINFEDFHAVFNGDDAVMNSSAYVTVRVTDAVSGLTRFLTFVAYKSPTGVVTATAVKNVKIWPNPATTALNVSFNPNTGIRSVSVYNTIGKVVSQYRVQGSSAKLDISNLPAGVYILRLSGAKGELIETKRFTVK